MQKLYSLTRIAESDCKDVIASTITDLFYTTVTKAIGRLEWENKNLKTPYGLCECYYKYVVIEEAILDDNDYDWEFQIWYELKEQENGDYIWTEIECPKKYQRTVSFYASGK